MSEGYVYVMASNKDGPVKIGRAASPALRCRALQSGHPWPLIVFAKEKTDNSVDVENVLHRKLAHARLRGEWFSLSVQQAIQVLTDIIASGVTELPASEGGRMRKNVIVNRPAYNAHMKVKMRAWRAKQKEKAR